MVNPSAPHAVLVDIGNTVLEERRFDLEAGIAAVVTETRETVERLAAAFRSELAELHRHDREPLLADWLQRRVPSIARESVAAIENAIWNAVVTLVPRAGAAEALARLSADRIPVGAVSNAPFSGRVLSAELDRHGLGDGLRFVVSSADAGVRKPAPAIFTAAVVQLGADPRHTWFVGDSLEEDVAGAIAAGLQPVWFRGGGADRRATAAMTVDSWTEFLTLYDSLDDRT